MRKLLPAIFCLLTVSVMAKTVVIAKVGETVPVSFFLGDILHSNNQPKMLSANHPISADFPVSTSLLSPGTVQAKSINEPLLTRAVFIVGDDDLSKKWLKKYANKLIQLHALGLIVNTTGSHETKEIEDKCHIRLLPVTGAEISKRFNLKHYPVLISQHKIEQ